MSKNEKQAKKKIKRAPNKIMKRGQVFIYKSKNDRPYTEREEQIRAYCTCKTTKTHLIGSYHLTEVDSDDVCVHCGHYALIEREPRVEEIQGCKYNVDRFTEEFRLLLD